MPSRLGPSWHLLEGDPEVETCQAGRQIVDPAEPWELPLPSAAAVRTDPRGKAARLLLPTCESDLPTGMLRAMRSVCGPLPLQRVLLLAPGVRPIDRFCRRFVVVPPQVLAFGERAVGLWAERQVRDPVALAPLHRIGLVEDLVVLRYRRLTLRTAAVRLSIRYDEETGCLLPPLLRWVRSRLSEAPGGARPEPARAPAAAPQLSEGAPRLPEWTDRSPGWRAWRQIAAAEIAAGASLIVAGPTPAQSVEASVQPGGSPTRLRDASPRCVLILLTPDELQVVSAPAEGEPGAAPAAPDRLAFPRRTLQAVEARAGWLTIRSAGVERTLWVGKTLAREARERLERPGRRGDSGASRAVSEPGPA